jgi:hypothetical protein
VCQYNIDEPAVVAQLVRRVAIVVDDECAGRSAQTAPLT